MTKSLIENTLMRDFRECIRKSNWNKARKIIIRAINSDYSELAKKMTDIYHEKYTLKKS